MTPWMETRIYDPQDHSVFGRGEPVLLLPGLIGGRWLWEKTIPYFLSGGYRVIAMEHPLAIWAARHGSIHELRNSILKFYEYMELERAILVGHSVGGLLALALAKTHPKLVRGVIACGVPGLGDSQEHGVGLDRLPLGDRPKAFELLGRKRSLDRIAKLLGEARGIDMAATLSTIHRPALLLWGRQDHVTPPTEWRTAAELLPDGAFVSLDGCGHYPMLEKPQAFGTKAMEFLVAMRMRRKAVRR